MKQPLFLLLFAGAILMGLNAVENIRLAAAPAAVTEKELTPAQVKELVAGMNAHGIKLHPAAYWEAVYNH